MFTTEQRGDFLDQTAAADDAFFRNTPDESFSELQQELFGSEEVRTQAFPDPSVNPLPLLHEPQDKDDDNAGSGLFQQSGF